MGHQSTWIAHQDTFMGPIATRIWPCTHTSAPRIGSGLLFLVNAAFEGKGCALRRRTGALSRSPSRTVRYGSPILCRNCCHWSAAFLRGWLIVLSIHRDMNHADRICIEVVVARKHGPRVRRVAGRTGAGILVVVVVEFRCYKKGNTVCMGYLPVLIISEI